ncbi:MAG: CotH kinase family protein, partial [Dehalococcoidia bacterium]|nr:CotH kinase family protein [Dehalococcoidia bacterium]
DAGSQDSEQLNIGGGKWLEILQALEQWELADDQIVIPEEPRPDPRQPRDFLDVMELKTNEGSTDHSALFRLLEVINNEPDETFPDEIEKVLDVDAALRYLAVSTLLVHLDNYIGIGHNYYLYEVDGKFTMIPWDLNMAFGGFTCSIGREGLINLYIDEPTCGPLAERPLVQRLLSHQPYLDTYHEYLEAMLDRPFSADAVESRIDELADLIRPFVQKDELKFFSTADFERALSEDISVPGQPGAPSATPPPLPIPNLSPESLDCLKQYFTKNEFQELLTRKPTQVEFQKLKYCLTLEELTAFLQRRPGQAPPPAQMGPRPGRTHIGLKTFVAERSLSVRQQLAGKRPSHGDGSGNGGKGFGLPGKPGQPGAPPPAPRKNPPGGRP